MTDEDIKVFDKEELEMKRWPCLCPSNIRTNLFGTIEANLDSCLSSSLSLSLTRQRFSYVHMYRMRIRSHLKNNCIINTFMRMHNRWVEGVHNDESMGFFIFHLIIQSKWCLWGRWSGPPINYCAKI